MFQGYVLVPLCSVPLQVAIYLGFFIFIFGLLIMRKRSINSFHSMCSVAISMHFLCCSDQDKPIVGSLCFVKTLASFSSQSEVDVFCTVDIVSRLYLG